MQVPLSNVLNREDSKDVRPEEITELAESITQYGLFHPVIVQQVNNDQYRVVAGQRRKLALEFLKWETIDVEIVVIESDDHAREINLQENLQRDNLEWWQETLLIKEFHELRQKQHGGKDSVGRPKKGDEGWTVRDTAAALHKSLGTVSQDLNLAKHVAANPGLRGVKDKRTAMKLVRAEAQRITEEQEAGAYIPEGLILDDVLLGDSSEILKHIPDQSFDACITDPPWLSFQGKKELEKDERTHLVFKEVFRVLKYNSLLYMFVGHADYDWYEVYLETLGFEISKIPLFWIKENGMTRIGVKNWEYGRNFEFILQAAKGSPVLKTSNQQPATFTFPVVPTARLIHPNEKPVPLLQKILKDCTFENNAVLDPFAGSGALLEAAKISNRRFLGIERSKEFYDNVRKRLGLETKE